MVAPILCLQKVRAYNTWSYNEVSMYDQSAMPLSTGVYNTMGSENIRTPNGTWQIKFELLLKRGCILLELHVT